FRKKVSPQCPFCDKRFRNEVSLKKHFVKKHPECVEFVQCLDCFKCLPDKSHLTEHECDMTWLCYECSPIQNMCTEQRFTNHRAKFHRGANSGFRCNECNQKFLTPRKLRKHRKMSHVFVKTYSCHFCEELFTSEVSVMTHERIHTGIIKFECKICDFRCNRYIQMENHKKEDHGYLCSICQESFGEWAEIKNHTLSKHGGYLTSDTYTGIKGIFIVLTSFAGKALHSILPSKVYSRKVAKKDLIFQQFHLRALQNGCLISAQSCRYGYLTISALALCFLQVEIGFEGRLEVLLGKKIADPKCERKLFTVIPTYRLVATANFYALVLTAWSFSLLINLFFFLTLRVLFMTFSSF
ncbi:zinc finger, C2H2 type, partial [Ancylostoma caninum]